MITTEQLNYAKQKFAQEKYNSYVVFPDDKVLVFRSKITIPLKSQQIAKARGWKAYDMYGAELILVDV